MLVHYLSNFSSYTVVYMIKYFKITELYTMMYTLVYIIVYNLYTIDFHPVIHLCCCFRGDIPSLCAFNICAYTSVCVCVCIGVCVMCLCLCVCGCV